MQPTIEKYMYIHQEEVDFEVNMLTCLCVAGVVSIGWERGSDNSHAWEGVAVDTAKHPTTIYVEGSITVYLASCLKV